MGQPLYPGQAPADYGRWRRQQWLPAAAVESGTPKSGRRTGSIAVCHFPPGTSKWNKIEHRLFSFISKNWRGKPLISHEVIVNLIAATTTVAGLKVRAQRLDSKAYPARLFKVS